MLGVVTKIVRGGLGLALSFWIAGAGCMFGCQNMVAFAASRDEAVDHEPSLAAVVSGDACAAAGSHDCCAKKKAEAKAKTQNANNRLTLKLATLISQSESLNTVPSSGGRECPLAVNRAIAVTKRSDNNKQSATPAVIAVSTPAVPVLTEQHAALSRSWHLPNRGHTYLRCCVFLI
ncbi:MAG: hypothetical protein ACR2H6_04785 [Pyrinomonadaceae bacterium]